MARVKPELDQMIEALGASLVTRCRDENGDWRVVGSRGHIYAQDEGFYLYHDAGSKQAWTWAKKYLHFCKVTQDGDDEGVFLLDRLPNPLEAEMIRVQIHIRKRKAMSDKERERLTKGASEMRSKSPLFGKKTASTGGEAS